MPDTHLATATIHGHGSTIAAVLAKPRPATLTEIALDLAKQGWPVFPCNAEKRPAIPEDKGGHGHLEAVTDPKAVRALFARAPHAKLVGVPTGKRTGLLVIDIDPRHQGDVWEADVADQLPVSRMHSTQHGGRHRVFQYVEGIHGRTNCPAPGVDVRAEGNYIVMPPSAGYAVITDAEIAPPPGWLLDRIRRAPPPPPRPFIKTDPDRITDKRLNGIMRSLLARISNAPEGLKHETLRDTSLTLGGYAHLLPYGDGELIALAVGALPDTVEDWENARKTAAWAIAEGRKRPLDLEDRPYHRANGNGHKSPPPPPKEPEQRQSKVGRLRVLGDDELLALPARDYLVKGWISPNEISLMVGAKNARKTFLALHVARAIAQGRRVFKLRVKQAPTLYVVCEGELGIGKRVKALALCYGRSATFHVIAQPIDLLRSTATEGDLADLIEVARSFRVRMIVVDTVSRVAPGAKENSPEDMGALLGNLTLLRDATGAHVMGVHHGTQEEGTKSRGHSVLPNGTDAIAQVEWTGDGNGSGTVKLGFARDDVAAALGAFRTKPIELGTDADGDPITTLLIEELDPADSPSMPDKGKLSDKASVMLNVFRNVVAQHGEPMRPTADMPLVTGITRDLLREGLIAAGWFDEGQLLPAFEKPTLTKAAYTAENNELTKLKRRSFLAFSRKHAWLI